MASLSTYSLISQTQSLIFSSAFIYYSRQVTFLLLHVIDLLQQLRLHGGQVLVHGEHDGVCGHAATGHAHFLHALDEHVQRFLDGVGEGSGGGGLPQGCRLEGRRGRWYGLGGRSPSVSVSYLRPQVIAGVGHTPYPSPLHLRLGLGLLLLLALLPVGAVQVPCHGRVRFRFLYQPIALVVVS